MIYLFITWKNVVSAKLTRMTITFLNKQHH